MMESLFGRPTGTWKRYVAVKIPTRKGKRLRQRDIPTTEAGAWYAQLFLEEHSEHDLYFTPALFKHSKDGRRTATQAAWVSWIWLDIDGVPGARTGGEAWAKLADTLDDLRIPQPNLGFCTSEKPDDPGYLPRLQVYWRIVPLYVGDLEARRLWRRVAGELADALAAAGFRVDHGASTNLVGLMRLPGSYNSKTGTQVELVGPTHGLVFTLTELLEALAAQKTPAERPANGFCQLRPRSDKAVKRGKLTELPHLKTLAQGVDEGVRNLALYGLAKALWADGVSLEEAVEWALAWNEQCDPPEDPEKIRDVVARAYGAYGPQAEPENFTGLDPEIVAAVVTAVTGQPTEPDPRLRIWFPHPKERREHWQPTQTRHRINGSKPSATRRRGRRRSSPPTWLQIGEACKPLVRELARSGGLLTLKAVATATGVSRRTAERHSKLVLHYLQAQLNIQIIRGPQGFYIKRLTGTKKTLEEREPPLNPPIDIVGGAECRLKNLMGGGSPSMRVSPPRASPSASAVAAFVEQVHEELVGRGLSASEVARKVAETRELLARLYGDGNGVAHGH